MKNGIFLLLKVFWIDNKNAKCLLLAPVEVEILPVFPGRLQRKTGRCRQKIPIVSAPKKQYLYAKIQQF